MNLRRTGPSVASVMAILIAIASMVGRAHADPWGTDTSETGAHPDSNPHTYCAGNSFSWWPRVENIENNALGKPTDANVVYNSSCDYSSSTETDVVWYVAELSGTTRGTTRCEDFDTYCDQYYVKIDYNYIIESSDPDGENVSKTICHELGHTVGLSHGSTYGGCMVSGEVSGDLSYRRYSSHHVGHINAWFS